MLRPEGVVCGWDHHGGYSLSRRVQPHRRRCLDSEVVAFDQLKVEVLACRMDNPKIVWNSAARV